MRGFLEMAKTRHEKDSPASPWLIAFKGDRIHSLKTAWKRACDEPGTDGSLFHDLRRTALSNMEEAGIPRSTARAISGHRTESAYKRYLIGSERRAVQAGQMMEQFWQAKE
jgi:integrase